MIEFIPKLMGIVFVMLLFACVVELIVTALETKIKRRFKNAKV